MAKPIMRKSKKLLKWPNLQEKRPLWYGYIRQRDENYVGRTVIDQWETEEDQENVLIIYDKRKC